MSDEDGLEEFWKRTCSFGILKQHVTFVCFMDWEEFSHESITTCL